MKYMHCIRVFSLLIILGTSQKSLSQIIDFRDSTQIKNVIQEYRSYFYDTTKIFISNCKFNDYGKIEQAISYENNNIQKSVRYFFDDSQKVVKAVIYDKENQQIYLPDTTIERYIYNKEHLLTATIITNIKDSLLWMEAYQYNEKGDMIQSEYYEFPRYLKDIMPDYAKDSMYYDYANNKVYGYTLSKDGSVIIESESSINPHLISTNERDEMGNMIENEDAQIIYEYDTHGNWIDLKSYSKAKGIKKLEYTKKRKIEYREK